eukprot:7688422-Pyramimonas_sp.AAC.1
MVPSALCSRDASSTLSAATALWVSVQQMCVAAGAFVSSAGAPPCTATALQPSCPTTRTPCPGRPWEHRSLSHWAMRCQPSTLPG